jgi:hypothetical protein
LRTEWIFRLLSPRRCNSQGATSALHRRGSPDRAPDPRGAMAPVPSRLATRYDRWRPGAAGRSRLSRLGECTMGRLASAH